MLPPKQTWIIAADTCLNEENNMTTENQIEKARKLRKELHDAINKPNDSFYSVTLDDWSDYASFRIFVSFPCIETTDGFYQVKDEINLRKVGWGIRRVFARHTLVSEIESIEMPRQSYYSWKYGRSSKGYNNPYVKLDFRLFNC